MTDTKPSKFLGFISGLFRIFSILIWVAFGSMVLAAAVLPWSSAVRDDFCRVPVSFALGDTSIAFRLGGNVYDTGLVRATGLLRIEGGPLWLSYLNLGVFLIVLAVILYCLGLARRIVDRVREDHPFASENALALRRIAVASLLLFGFFVLLRMGFLLFATGRIVTGPLVVGVSGSDLDFDLGNLILPLFLWVLAEVFRIGSDLKKDQDLTI